MSYLPQIHSVYDPNEQRQKQRMQDQRQNKAQEPRVKRVTDMNKSYESMGSNEQEQPHYNFDSDGEPPTDQVGDKLTVVKRQQVTKTILVPGDNSLGKPGKPYIVKVSLLGYFAPKEAVKDPENEETKETASIKTKEVSETHIRVAADDIEGRGEVFVDHS